MKMHHNSATAARTELVKHGFVDKHVPPGHPQVWRKPKPDDDTGEFVVAHNTGTDQYDIMPAEEIRWLDAL